MQVSIYRYNPDVDEAPQMRDMALELPKGQDLMVLDVLERLKEQDPSLSYRRSCREGVCGSDGVNMNGKKRAGLHHSGLGRGEARQAGPAPPPWPARDSRLGGRYGPVLCAI